MPSWTPWKKVEDLRGLRGPKGDTGPAGLNTVGNIPIGAILIWNGGVESIPYGYALCNGVDGTPDLRGRFVLGWNNEDEALVPGSTGGSRDAVVVGHDHGVTDNGHFHVHSATNNPPAITSLEIGSIDVFTPTIVEAFDTSTEISGVSVNMEGVSGLGANMPPYYVAIYIIRIF